MMSDMFECYIANSDHREKDINRWWDEYFKVLQNEIMKMEDEHRKDVFFIYIVNKREKDWNL